MNEGNSESGSRPIHVVGKEPPGATRPEIEMERRITRLEDRHDELDRRVTLHTEQEMQQKQFRMQAWLRLTTAVAMLILSGLLVLLWEILKSGLEDWINKAVN